MTNDHKDSDDNQNADDENTNYWVDNNTLITTAVPVAPDWKLIQNKQKTLETNTEKNTEKYLVTKTHSN